MNKVRIVDYLQDYKDYLEEVGTNPLCCEDEYEKRLDKFKDFVGLLEEHEVNYGVE